MSEIVLILSTVPSLEVGERIARALVDARVAACVNVGAPTRSVYRWNGVVESAVEFPLTIKTTSDRVAEAEDRLKKLHPYELPEWLVLSAKGSVAYLDWVVAETRR